MKKIKIFLDPIHKLSPWLEQQNSKGYRLKKILGPIYEFEPCDTKYHYSIEYLGARSHKDVDKYIAFLKELGYRIFFAPIDQGSIAFCKMRFRPYKKDLIATTFTNSFNKEILIIESTEAPDGPPLSSPYDLKEYYRQIKHTYLYVSMILLFFLCSLLYKGYRDPTVDRTLLFAGSLVLGSLFLAFGKIGLRAAKKEHHYEQESKLRT
ncbi:MAG: DUF2812 domain-containing protein [Peptostreptococcaceae bacterium]|nr:DUF2812 domain-containing protein [Peptostreptococcaceae bacterium]